VADQVDPAEARCCEEPAKPRSELPGPQTTKPGQFHEVELEVGREALDERQPPPPGAGQPVHDHDVRARAGHAVTGRRSIERELSQLHARILHPETADISQLG
jgi:hypothetical protein